jgi:hypothetical protein
MGANLSSRHLARACLLLDAAIEERALSQRLLDGFQFPNQLLEAALNAHAGLGDVRGDRAGECRARGHQPFAQRRGSRDCGHRRSSVPAAQNDWLRKLDNQRQRFTCDEATVAVVDIALKERDDTSCPARFRRRRRVQWLRNARALAEQPYRAATDLHIAGLVRITPIDATRRLERRDARKLRVAGEHGGCDAVFVSLKLAEIVGSLLPLSFQARENVILKGTAVHQMDRVDAARLTETVDSADALLEPQRAPGELYVDNQPAAFLQIQAFAGGIGGQQNTRAAAYESMYSLTPFLGR